MWVDGFVLVLLWEKEGKGGGKRRGRLEREGSESIREKDL